MKLSQLDQDTKTKVKKVTRASPDLGRIIQKMMADPECRLSDLKRMLKDMLEGLGEDTS